MRKDMAKVVTEAPRRGHANPSRKWGRRLTRDEYALDDHGASRGHRSRATASMAGTRKSSPTCSGRSADICGKQVGRPWDKIWSEITRTLDSRSLTGLHIFDHIRSEVEQEAWLGDDGRLYRKRRCGTSELVSGLYVHPGNGLLCWKAERRWAFRRGAFLRAHTALRVLGISAATARDIRRYRVEGLRVWERRESGWFVHIYRHVPEQLVRVITRSDGRAVPIYGSAHYERVATKQASKKEIRAAQSLLRQDPLAG